MNLIYKLDLDNLKMYLHTENEVSGSRLSKVRAQTGQTDIQRERDAIERITTLHSRVAITIIIDRPCSVYGCNFGDHENIVLVQLAEG